MYHHSYKIRAIIVYLLYLDQAYRNPKLQQYNAFLFDQTVFKQVFKIITSFISQLTYRNVKYFIKFRMTRSPNRFCLFEKRISQFHF